MPYARTTAALASVLGTIAFLVTQPLSGQQPTAPAAAASPFGAVSTAAPMTTPVMGGMFPGYPAGASPYSVPVNDPEMTKVLTDEARLDQEASAIVEEYARTEDEGQRSKLKSKLSAALEKQFDLQQKRRELEVARIETQLKKLREVMRKRTDARQAIVDKRLDQLVREAEGLGWTTPGSSSRRGATTYYPSAGVPSQVSR